MADNNYIIIAVYFTIISAIGVFMTIKDKSAAKIRAKRVPENTLLTLGFLGAALPMFLVMNIIHHKTKHPKFMIGLPVAIVLHIALIAGVYFLLNKPAETLISLA